jgi:hypothetical protein
MNKDAKNLSTFLLLFGLCLTGLTVVLQGPAKAVQKNSFLQSFPLQSVIASGHHEIAWTLVAIGGLTATVNAWSAYDDPVISKDQLQLQRARFEESVSHLSVLAPQSTGMVEVFLFPTSFLAFGLNDIDQAIQIARLGASDVRIEPQLALAVAYLSHLFKGDLAQAVKDYERLAFHFPTVLWLQDIIKSLKNGIDPFNRPGRDRKNICRSLQSAFPLARKTLIERGICRDSIHSNGEMK